VPCTVMSRKETSVSRWKRMFSGRMSWVQRMRLSSQYSRFFGVRLDTWDRDVF